MITIEALDERRDPTVPEQPALDRDDEPADADGDDERRIICAACAHHITNASARHSFADGRWEQRFVNPHGVLFTLGRYSSARGCTAEGAPSTDFSWFAGHSWQIQLCGGCLRHLGWLFRDLSAGQAPFYGLRVERLREVDCRR